MPEVKPFLCDGCPAKGDKGVDIDLGVYQSMFTADVFRQARRYRLQDGNRGQTDQDDKDTAAESAMTLLYWDDESGDYNEIRANGDLKSAWRGILCARKILAGECPKTPLEAIIESSIDGE